MAQPLVFGGFARMAEDLEFSSGPEAGTALQCCDGKGGRVERGADAFGRFPVNGTALETKAQHQFEIFHAARHRRRLIAPATPVGGGDAGHQAIDLAAIAGVKGVTLGRDAVGFSAPLSASTRAYPMSSSQARVG
jgi:hypothetical protein